MGGTGTGACPVTTPTWDVTLGRRTPAPVGVGPLVGTSGHSGTWQQVGSLGSGTAVQPAGMSGNLAHLVNDNHNDVDDSDNLAEMGGLRWYCPALKSLLPTYVLRATTLPVLIHYHDHRVIILTALDAWRTITIAE